MSSPYETSRRKAASVAMAALVLVALPSRPRVGYSSVLLGTAVTMGTNQSGQLGQAPSYSNATPTQVHDFYRWTSISSRDEHVLAVMDGGVWGWGANGAGQLGLGYDGGGLNCQCEWVPHKTVGLSGVSAVAAGSGMSLALKSDGTVWSWGNNWYGQLGDNSSIQWRNVPQQVPGLSGVVAVAAGLTHGLALKSDGTVWGWGDNRASQVGPGGTMIPAPIHVGGLPGVVAIAAGGYASYALTAAGSVWAWGANDQGQLANGATGDPIAIPSPVVGLTDVVQVAGGSYHALALKSDGKVWGWGANFYGELGDGTLYSAPRTVPGQAMGLSGVTSIAAGADHSLALKSDRTVWGWGDSLAGEGGLPLDFHAAPTLIAGVSGARGIVAGHGHTIVIIPPPPPPRNVTATPGSAPRAIDLSWEASAPGDSAPVAGYHIYRGQMPNSITSYAFAPATGTHFTDSNASTIGARYYYYVAAFSVVEGAPSNQACSRAFPWVGALGCSV
ncbi:MAG: hypothetical protein ABR548_02225 [Actinomycetota bacterium]|nr:hypothetical protein [Actinomycetota bacterium]